PRGGRRPASARSGASSTVMASPLKKTLHAAEQDRPDVAAERAALKSEQPKLRAPRLVFIDETAVTTKMVRHYGRSPRRRRAARPLEDVDACRCAPHRWPHSALCHRWRDGWAVVPGLCRAGPGA